MALLTRILKPQKFNSTELGSLIYAGLMGNAKAPAPRWEDLTEDLQRYYVDVAQQVLDQMRAEGIIG